MISLLFLSFVVSFWQDMPQWRTLITHRTQRSLLVSIQISVRAYTSCDRVPIRFLLLLFLPEGGARLQQSRTACVTTVLMTLLRRDDLSALHRRNCSGSVVERSAFNYVIVLAVTCCLFDCKCLCAQADSGRDVQDG